MADILRPQIGGTLVPQSVQQQPAPMAGALAPQDPNASDITYDDLHKLLVMQAQMPGSTWGEANLGLSQTDALRERQLRAEQEAQLAAQQAAQQPQ